MIYQTQIYALFFLLGFGVGIFWPKLKRAERQEAEPLDVTRPPQGGSGVPPKLPFCITIDNKLGTGKPRTLTIIHNNDEVLRFENQKIEGQSAWWVR